MFYRYVRSGSSSARVAGHQMLESKCVEQIQTKNNEILKGSDNGVYELLAFWTLSIVRYSPVF
jgi:hypothetical protein